MNVHQPPEKLLTPREALLAATIQAARILRRAEQRYHFEIEIEVRLSDVLAELHDLAYHLDPTAHDDA